MGFSTWDISVSFCSLVLSFSIIFLGPTFLLRNARGCLEGFLALCGFYCLGFYLKPKGLPIESLIGLAYSLSALYWRLKTKGEYSFVSLVGHHKKTIIPLLLIATYCFCLMLGRWEPAGTDPVKWASLTRLILSQQQIVGSLWPMGSFTLEGGVLGIPILTALNLSLWEIPLERGVFFWESIGVCVFVLMLAKALRVYVSEAMALWGALLTLVLFAVPQNYFSWGGTPTLLGMSAGFLLFSLLAEIKERIVFTDFVLISLALGFGAYAHPMGFFLSLLVGVLLLLGHWLIVKGSWRIRLINILLCAIGSNLVFLPFWFGLGEGPSESELAMVWQWQKLMSPTLLLDNSFVLISWNYLKQTLWESALLLGGGCLVFALTRKQWRRVACIQLLVLIVIGALVLNVRSWSLPLSYLFYPDRLVTLAVWPLSVGFVAAGHCIFERKKLHWVHFLLCFTLLGLGARQFSKHLLPMMGTSRMTPSDHVAFDWIEKEIPETDCIQIKMNSVASWITPLSNRCTWPFHGWSMHTFEEERAEKSRVRWEFFTKEETVPPEKMDKIRFQNSAKVIEY